MVYLQTGHPYGIFLSTIGLAVVPPQLPSGRGRPRSKTLRELWSLRDLYRTRETPGANRLRDAHAALDSAVRAAYGMKAQEDPLAFLLRLNLELAQKEARAQSITPPGLPAWVRDGGSLVCRDCIQVQ